MAVKQFILDRSKRSYYRGRDGKVTCRKCFEPIHLGEKVVSRDVNCGNGHYRVLYHQYCAEEVCII